MAITVEPTRVPATGEHDTFHRVGIAVRGAVAIAFGLCALWFRVYSVLLVDAFVAFAIIDGAVRLILSLRATGRDRAWFIHALEGALGIVLGIIAWNFARSLVSLTWTISEWAFGIGFLTIVFAVLARRHLKDAWLWMVTGVVLMALGGALLFFTLGGLLAPGLALGLFGIVYGVVSIVLAMRHRTHAAAKVAIDRR